MIRPIYKNTLVFPVWVFDGKWWHIYDTTEFAYEKHLHRKHLGYCGKRIEETKQTAFELLGLGFLKMDNICPKCREHEIAVLKSHGYLNDAGDIIRREG